MHLPPQVAGIVAIGVPSAACFSSLYLPAQPTHTSLAGAALHAAIRSSRLSAMTSSKVYCLAAGSGLIIAGVVAAPAPAAAIAPPIGVAIGSAGLGCAAGICICIADGMLMAGGAC